MSDLALRLTALSGHSALDLETRDTLANLARHLPAALSRGGLPTSRLKVETEILADGLEGLVRERAAGVSADLDTAAAHLLRLGHDLAARASALAAGGAADLLAETEVAAQGAPAPGDLTQSWAALRAALPASDGGARVRAVPTGFEPGACDLGRVTGDFITLTVDRSASCAPADARILPPGGRISFAEGESFLLHHAGSIEGGPEEVPKVANFTTVMIQAGKGGAVLEGPAVLSPCGLRIDMENAIKIPDDLGQHFPEKGLNRMEKAGMQFMSGVGLILAGLFYAVHSIETIQERGTDIVVGFPEIMQVVSFALLAGSGSVVAIFGLWKAATGIGSKEKAYRNMKSMKDSLSTFVRMDRLSFRARNLPYEFMRGLDVRRSGGLNAFPPRMILARAGGIETIRALRALPALEPVFDQTCEKAKVHD